MARPNIVYIMTDQQHYQTLRCTGYEHARTPNIDSLARNGINFRNHFVTNPVCSPSRASIITGKYVTEHGLWANGCSLPQTEATTPSLLREHGYLTAHFGKLHLVPILNRTETHPAYGFEVCEVAEGDDNLFTDAYGEWLKQNNREMFEIYFSEGPTKGHDSGYASQVSEKWHHSTWVTDRTVAWLRNLKTGDSPFYLSVGFFDPHSAFNPCEPYWSLFDGVELLMPKFREGSIETRPPHYLQRFKANEKFTRDPQNMQSILRAYHAMVAHVDVCVGRIVTELERMNLAGNTLVIFTSDHGEMLGNHGLLRKGPFLLDDLLHVPLVMTYPGRSRPAVTVDDLTSGVDMTSTILSVAGCLDGHTSSGAPILDGELNLFPLGRRRHVFAQWEDGPARETGNLNPLVAKTAQRNLAREGPAPKSSQAHDPTSSMRCLRTREYKLVLYNSPDMGELYDLRTDPGEFSNEFRNPAYAAARRSLVREMDGICLCEGPRPEKECLW